MAKLCNATRSRVCFFATNPALIRRGAFDRPADHCRRWVGYELLPDRKTHTYAIIGSDSQRNAGDLWSSTSRAADTRTTLTITRRCPMVSVQF
jgi:hypothetical protein